MQSYAVLIPPQIVSGTWNSSAILSCKQWPPINVKWILYCRVAWWQANPQRQGHCWLITTAVQWPCCKGFHSVLANLLSRPGLLISPDQTWLQVVCKNLQTSTRPDHKYSKFLHWQSVLPLPLWKYVDSHPHLEILVIWNNHLECSYLLVVVPGWAGCCCSVVMWRHTLDPSPNYSTSARQKILWLHCRRWSTIKMTRSGEDWSSSLREARRKQKSAHIFGHGPRGALWANLIDYPQI